MIDVIAIPCTAASPYLVTAIHRFRTPYLTFMLFLDSTFLGIPDRRRNYSPTNGRREFAAAFLAGLAGFTQLDLVSHRNQNQLIELHAFLNDL
jgi:hypothetical protein